MEWFYELGGREAGPISEQELERLVAEGDITNQTLVWRQGMPNWKTYGEVSARAGQLDMTAPFEPNQAVAMSDFKACCECGRSLPEEDLMKHRELFVCAACKPVFLQRLREGTRLPTDMFYAGFWIRFAAKLIDSVILAVANGIVNATLAILLTGMRTVSEEAIGAFLVLMGFQWVLNLGVQIGYATWFGGRFGATPGKMAVGLKIVTANGEDIDYKLALWRVLAEFLSGLTLGIGYIIAAFDDEKRTLHDRIVHTRVIQK